MGDFVITKTRRRQGTFRSFVAVPLREFACVPASESLASFHVPAPRSRRFGFRFSRSTASSSGKCGRFGIASAERFPGGQSVEHGCFGSPTFFVGEEIYFGKDRLRDVEGAILGAAK